MTGVCHFFYSECMQENKDRFKAHLKKMGYSFNKCAQILKMDKGSLWRYTSGLREPTEDIRKKLKNKLGFVWQGDDGMPSQEPKSRKKGTNSRSAPHTRGV